jgi:hypothetical protein
VVVQEYQELQGLQVQVELQVQQVLQVQVVYQELQEQVEHHQQHMVLTLIHQMLIIL